MSKQTETTKDDFKIVRDYLGYMESRKDDPLEETIRQDAISALARIKFDLGAGRF